MAGVRTKPIAIANTKPVRSFFIMLSAVQGHQLRTPPSPLEEQFPIKLAVEVHRFASAKFGAAYEIVRLDSRHVTRVGVISRLHSESPAARVRERNGYIR